MTPVADDPSSGVAGPQAPPIRTFIFNLLVQGKDIDGNPTFEWKEQMIEAHSTQVTDGNSLLFFVVSLNPQGMYLRNAYNQHEWRGMHEVVNTIPATASVN